MTTTHERNAATSSRAASWVLFIIDGGLLVASGIIHLHLWDIAYKNVATLGPLFLVQAISALVIAVAIVATRHLLAVAAGLALAAGTILGFILARTVGIFGFKLTFSSGLANTVLIIEAVAVVLLTMTAAMILRRRGLSAILERPGQG
jgi:hypothetical protein